MATKKNRMLEPAEKTSLIEGYKAEIEKAKTVVEANKSEDAKYSKGAAGKKVYRVKGERKSATDDGIKRTGRIHVVSKKPVENSED